MIYGERLFSHSSRGRKFVGKVFFSVKYEGSREAKSIKIKRNEGVDMNYEWFSFINQFAGDYPSLDKVMVFAAEKSLIVFPLVLLIMWLFGKQEMKYTVVYAAITCVIGLIINNIVGYFHYVDRPFVTHTVNLLIEHEADFSFPSNHTTGAFTIALAVLWRNKIIGVPLFLFAMLTGVGRIFVGVHFPMDVLGSMVISLLVSIFVLKIANQLKPILRLIVNLYYYLPIVPKFLKR